MATGIRTGMRTGRGAPPPLSWRQRLLSRRTALLALVILLDLGALLQLIQPQERRLTTQAQAILDDSLGPHRARCDVQRDARGRTHVSVSLSGQDPALVSSLLTRALGLNDQRGDSLSVIQQGAPPEPKPWPNLTPWLAGIVALGLGCWGLVGLTRAGRRAGSALAGRWRIWREAREARRAEKAARPPAPPPEPAILQPDDLRLELAAPLLKLVNPRKGAPLLKRLEDLRVRYAREVGAPPPRLAIERSESLEGHHWRLFVRGQRVDEGKPVEGLEHRLWLEMRARCLEWLGVDEVDRLLAQLHKTQPALIAEVRRRLELAWLTARLREHLGQTGSLHELAEILESLLLQKEAQ